MRRNLSLIRRIADEAGVEFILAFKAFALWRTFPIFREYISHTTASSPYEARLAFEEFGTKAHTYSPAYEDDTFDTILRCSSHISFNSLTQYSHFVSKVKEQGPEAPSIGLRINPEHSEIETELYNPCAPGSRFGVLASQLPEQLPDGIEGFHCHCHCESSAEALQTTLGWIERKFGKWLGQLKWLNLGPLVSQVVDIVENHGIKTAILNVSFTCHMPDCLEMPYHPAVRGAETLEDASETGAATEASVYRLGGNSCLSGDYMGYWRFPNPLKVGDMVIFEDMIHYTTVKTDMFNGIHHPALKIEKLDGSIQTLREYHYEDYRDRMD